MKAFLVMLARTGLETLYYSALTAQLLVYHRPDFEEDKLRRVFKDFNCSFQKMSNIKKYSKMLLHENQVLIISTTISHQSINSLLNVFQCFWTWGLLELGGGY